MNNFYLPLPSKILEVIPHTAREYTFRLSYVGDVKPGQFFEVSMPKYGEAPISVSGIGEGHVELTIRKVGRVTDEVFEHYKGQSLKLRGPYGNGFDLEQYKGKDLLIISGDTGAAPVRGVADYFARHPEERKHLTVLSSFKKEDEILFRTDYERWAKTADVHIALTRETRPTERWTGRLTNHIPTLPIPDIDRTEAIVVGPDQLMKSIAAMLSERGMPDQHIWVSQERRMCCGLGKCGHCRIGEKYICLDGPVFNYAERKDLLD